MRTRKRFALISCLLAFTAIGGGLAVGNLPARGAAQESVKRPRALVQIARHPPRILAAEVEHADDYPRYLKTQASLIKSRLVLTAAFRSPEARRLAAIKGPTDPLAWLEQNLEVTNLPDTELLQVAMAAGSGASGADQAALINAVVRAYMDEVVHRDANLRRERYDRLRKISSAYAENLRERRDTLRKLSSSAERDGLLAGALKESLPRLYNELRSQQVKLRLERAEAETILARRKKAEGSATDLARKEMAQIEDRLAVVIAQEKVLDQELGRVVHELRADGSQTLSNELDRTALKDEIAQMGEAAHKVADEVEAMNVELEAPPRVRLIEEAVPPSP
jgi:hypothetical protein